MRRRGTGICCVAFFGFVGVAAWPTSSRAAGNDTIHACYNRYTGRLRIAGRGGACFRFEAPISWNQQGPQGPQGEVGPIGPDGPPGPAILGGGTAGEVPNDSVSYIALFSPRFSANEGDVAQVVPTPGVLTSLYANSEKPPGCFHPGGVNCAAHRWRLTVMRNGQPTGLTCDIAQGGLLGSPPTPCAVSGAEPFSEGDTISIRVEPTGDFPGTVPDAPSAIRWTAAFSG
jgi:hypothetical protein